MPSINGEKREAVTDFIFLGSKITADSDCSHKTKSCLLLGRKDMTKLDKILKRRDIILLTKVHIVKAVAFLVVMYGYESWTIKKSECQITVLEKTLESPLDCKDNLKEMNLEYSLEGLKLKFQYFGHLM